MKKPIQSSVLFRTCSASDVQRSGGNITITGLPGGSIPVSGITSGGIFQVKYKAEVAQVVTVGSGYTPTSDTVYQIAVFDPIRDDGSYSEAPKIYKYRLNAADYTGVAATDRETISVGIVAAINNDATNHAVAATLGGGTGFTVTDDGGYHPVFSQSMTNVKGVNTVYTITNSDGGGWPDDLATVTTAAVYSFGVGSKLAQEAPIIDAVFGNLISGVLDAPPVTSAGLSAVSGQNYDGFCIETLIPVSGIPYGGQQALQSRTVWVFADNGTGTSTTNLTGFKAFERELHKAMVQNYSQDPSTLQEWFDTLICFQDPLGAAPTGTADTLGWQVSTYAGMYRINIGTQTIVAPVLADTGLALDQDDTATEGSHTCASIRTLGTQCYTVGDTAFMVGCRVVAADWTDVQFLFGFRKKAAYAADYNNYTDLAAIGGGAADGDSIFTHGILNNAATVATDTTVNFADAVSIMMWIKVDISGNVTCWVNGTEYPIYSVGTTDLVFDDGDVMIPFYQVVNIGGGDPATVISEFFSVPSDQLIN